MTVLIIAMTALLFYVHASPWILALSSVVAVWSLALDLRGFILDRKASR